MSKSINVWDYREEYEQEREEILAGIEKVLRSGRLILGPSVKGFEEAFARWCGVKFGVGVNSGTDALFLGLKALGIGPGDEVVTVSNTAIPTVSAIVSTGGVPRFVDIDPQTYLMDTAALEDTIGARTRCILPVHLFGQCVNMTAVNAVATKHGLSVLEDCAQSHGALHKGKKAGAMSQLAAFSFYPTKILGTYGDGGMVVTDSGALAKRLARLRMYGNEGTYYAVEHGYNSRLDELHAEILLRKLPRLDGYIKRRQHLAARYDRALARSGLQLPRTLDDNVHAYYLYVVRHPAREQLMRGLADQGINVNISYPWPIHTMQGYAHLGWREGQLPNTEAAAREIFSLPMYPSLSDEEQDRVCATLLDVLRRL